MPNRLAHVAYGRSHRLKVLDAALYCHYSWSPLSFRESGIIPHAGVAQRGRLSLLCFVANRPTRPISCRPTTRKARTRGHTRILAARVEQFIDREAQRPLSDSRQRPPGRPGPTQQGWPSPGRCAAGRRGWLAARDSA